VVLANVKLHRPHQAYDLFFSHLCDTSDTVGVRRAIDGGGLYQVFPSQKKSRALRAAHALAAAEGKRVSAAAQPDVTRAAGAPTSEAMRSPTAAWSSGIETYLREVSSIAMTTSRGKSEADRAV
jgi:hypothetical protein